MEESVVDSASDVSETSSVQKSDGTSVQRGRPGMPWRW